MLEDIYHFLRLSENLLTGGMPTAGQLGEVSSAGVQAVINLALPSTERALPNEASLVQSLGMQYIGIPVQWDHPTRRDLDEFMEAMDAHQHEKLFVHCQANYRATGFVTLYRVLRLGWDRDEAFKDLRRIWYPEDYPVWQRFIEANLPPR
jgi:protein tyrosine phosphatase (PTP) superfamily phosphohydrolase (DUF442 family)